MTVPTARKARENQNPTVIDNLEHVETTLDILLCRRIPLLTVVAIIGSTEESAVDPLAGLLALRERTRAQGFNFAVHADAA